MKKPVYFEAGPFRLVLRITYDDDTTESVTSYLYYKKIKEWAANLSDEELEYVSENSGLFKSVYTLEMDNYALEELLERQRERY